MSLSEVFVLFSLLTWCSAYNIDVKTTNAVVAKGVDVDEKSLFGFSLTLHTGKHFSRKPTIFVGAPRGDADNGKDRGDIFECVIKGNNADCSSIRIDATTGDIPKYEHRENQWLGATVFSNGEGPVLTCAPRYSEVDGKDNKAKYYMIGKCIVIPEKGTKYPFLYPCTNQAPNHRHVLRSGKGYCHAGFSATLRNISKTVVMGAIGSRDQDQGEVILQKKSQETKGGFDFSADPEEVAGGGFYLGYAVTYGHFYTQDEKIENIAASMPRIDYSGKVLIYSPKLSYLETVNPPAMVKQNREFIYFGASLCSIDVNGDGYSDLIVGAPFYSDRNKKGDARGDEGRVYVYLSSGKTGSRKLTLSSGENSADPGLRGDNVHGARFGWAIANAGDLNDDNYDDFIVGAPQDIPDINGDGFGNGAIYIYHGRKDGKIEEYQQKITAGTVAHYYKFSQFGYAVAGNVDTNDDEYPDIAVGAWESDRVLLLRTRPVMHMTATITLSKQEILVGNFTPDCADNSSRQCLDAKVCFSYHGKSVTGKQEIIFTFELDKEISVFGYKRVYLLEGGNRVYQKTENVKLTGKNDIKCVNYSQIHVEKGNRLTESLSQGKTDIVFYTKYELISPPECETSSLCPVLEETDSVTEKATLVFNCSDNTCDYDLQVKISLDRDEIIIGSEDKLIVTIELSNKDEISYNPEIRINHHPSLQYEKITVDKSVRKLTTSSANATDTVSEFEKFRMIGPLDRNEKVTFKLQYATRNNLLGSERELSIDVKAMGASAGQEKNDKDNTATASITVKRVVIMELTGTSQPKLLNYPATAPALNIKNKTDFSAVNISDIGPTVTVTIVLSNKGKSNLQSIAFNISYPLKKAKGKEHDYIVYPISVEAEGSGTCNTENNILNPESVPLPGDENTRRRRKREVLEFSNTIPGSFVCNINELDKDGRFIVTFEFRLWTKTLVQYYANELVVKVEAHAEYSDSLTDAKISKHSSVDILVSPENPPGKSKSTDVWIIIVSVLGGVLLLALAIFALFKLGFFKRNRPPKGKNISSPQTDEDEAQPVVAT